MKKVLLSFILSLVAINLFADIKGFEAKEIYIGYFLSDNYANVIEYDIQYDKNQKKIKPLQTKNYPTIWTAAGHETTSGYTNKYCSLSKWPREIFI